MLLARCLHPCGCAVVLLSVVCCRAQAQGSFPDTTATRSVSGQFIIAGTAGSRLAARREIATNANFVRLEPGLLAVSAERFKESLARKLFYDASWYEERGEMVSAVYMYRRLVHDYPRSAAAQDSIQRLTGLHVPVGAPRRAGRYFAPGQGPPTATAPAGETPPAGQGPTTSKSQELKP